MSTLSGVKLDSEMRPLVWRLHDCVALCRLLEPIASQCGAHVGLTGGNLYKDGPRKDCDIVVYIHGGAKEIERDKLRALIDINLAADWSWVKICGRVYKARYKNKPVDLIFPALSAEWITNDPDKESDWTD
jgi:hypothetical protein